MDKLSELTHGAKVVLGAAIAFLVISFFNWFELEGDLGEAVEAFAGDAGISMWNGVGWIAGLLAIALIVWQAVRLANIEVEIGLTPAMITAALAVLVLLFTVIRFIDKPGGDLVGRTIWAWIGLFLAILVCVGAWMNMKASGESLDSMRDHVSSMTSSGGGGGGGQDAAATTPPPAAPATPVVPETAAPVESAPAERTTETTSDVADDGHDGHTHDGDEQHQH